MARLTDAHRLYLYRLFASELGFNKQTSLADAAAVLERDGLAPRDMDCADERALFEQLATFAKLTTFKKGRVYVTILPQDDFDTALAKLDSPTEADKSTSKQAGNKAKPWKRKKGAKQLKPQKPRHIEVEETPEPEPALDPQPEPMLEPEAELTPEINPVEEIPAEHPTELPAEAHTEAPIEQQLESESEHTPESEPEPEPESAPEPESEPKPAPVLRESEVPHISLNITYVPEDDPEPALSPNEETQLAAQSLQSAAEHEARSAAGHRAPATPVTVQTTATAAPEATTSTTYIYPVAEAQLPLIKLQADLPQSLREEVYITNDVLSQLYQQLPPQADPFTLLDKDWQLARATAAIAGTRSQLRFALSLPNPEGTSSTTATLRRAGKLPSGKKWILDQLEPSFAPEASTSSNNAAQSVREAWCALSATPNPEEHFVPLEAACKYFDLGDLASLSATLQALLPAQDATPTAQHARIQQLCATLVQAQAQGLVAQSANGQARLMHSGLKAAGEGHIYLQFSKSSTHEDRWQLCRLIAGSAAAVLDQAPEFTELPAPALPYPQGTPLLPAPMATELATPQAADKLLRRLVSGSLGQSEAAAQLTALAQATEQATSTAEPNFASEAWQQLVHLLSESIAEALCCWQLDPNAVAFTSTNANSRPLVLLPLKLASVRPNFALVAEVDSEGQAFIGRTVVTRKQAAAVAYPSLAAQVLFGGNPLV